MDDQNTDPHEDHGNDPQCANDHGAVGTVQRGIHWYCSDCDDAGNYLPE